MATGAPNGLPVYYGSIAGITWRCMLSLSRPKTSPTFSRRSRRIPKRVAIQKAGLGRRFGSLQKALPVKRHGERIRRFFPFKTLNLHQIFTHSTGRVAMLLIGEFFIFFQKFLNAPNLCAGQTFSPHKKSSAKSERSKGS